MSRAAKVLVGFLLGVALSAMLFSAGVVVGAVLPSLHNAGQPVVASLATPAATATAPSPPGREALFAPFWQAWDIVHEEFVSQPVDDTALMRGAIRGMLGALGDEHTSYMDPDQYRQANMSLAGSYEGIGAWVDTTGQYLKIVAPMPGSPAEAAGLKPGDIVVAVDGKDMTGVDGSLVVQSILGPQGSTVRLTIRRQGVASPLEIEVLRANITVPSVESKMLEGGFGYVRLYTFGDQTADNLRAALQSLNAQSAEGLVLDLRGNGGGYLDSSVAVASEFLSGGIVLKERFGDGSERVYRVRSGGLATDLPLVVLVDQGTASASEIVAGAIQDAGRAQLVGQTTFGKGSVQDWIPLDHGQGAVRVSVAHWYTPNGRLIDGQGLKPDVEAALTDTDVQAQRDPQLDKAIELLRAAVGP